MLSQTLTLKKRIFSICERSGDILPGAAFRGVRFGDGDGSIPEDASVVCCGRISGDALLFRTEDGRIYFSVCDGWGEEDGMLYGMQMGFSFDFRHPTAVETLPAECDAALGTYSTWGGAMAYQARKRTLDVIRSVMA